MSGELTCRKELPGKYSGHIGQKVPACVVKRYELLSLPLQIRIITGYLNSQCKIGP